MSLSSEVATPASRRTSKRTAVEPAGAAPSAETTALLSPEESGPLTESANDELPDLTRVAGRVRLARTVAKLTKADLARRVGVCLSAAVQWELPKGTSPNVTNLIRIATATRVAFEWLATGRGSPKLAAGTEDFAKPEDLDFEIRLLLAGRAIPPERRAALIELARSLVEQ